jgi:hypothetical protein
MSRFWTLSGAVASAVSLAIVGLALRASAKPSGLLHAPASYVTPDLGFRGAGSCAASACHGGVEPVPATISQALRNEHTTWVTSDPHAGAYDVLLGDRSKSIARNLAKKGGKPIEAHLDARCLACHSTPSPKESNGVDGVSCESCHGASGNWLSEHTTIDWNQRDKASTGFRNMKDLRTRALTCAGCHIGAPENKELGLPARDMNHDFIAAGHPRLNWEFSAYSANSTKHWRISPPVAADIDARLWMTGQVASMIAALDLLTARADQAIDKTAPWPELSEYGCFSCHFALKDKLRQDSHDPEVPLGVPAWGSWNVPMLKQLAKVHPGAALIEPPLKDLRAEMAKFRTDPEKVKVLAAALRAPLEQWLGSATDRPLMAEEITALIQALRAPDGKGPIITGWDSAAQAYLGLTALQASQKEIARAKIDPKLESELKELLKELGFKPGYDGPRDEK